MSWNWWQPDPDGREHTEAWWAESETLHLTVCRSTGGGTFRWIVCGVPGGQVLAGGDAETVAAARVACEAAAARVAPRASATRSPAGPCGLRGGPQGYWRR
jgi:hypothetical protein